MVLRGLHHCEELNNVLTHEELGKAQQGDTTICKLSENAENVCILFFEETECG